MDHKRKQYVIEPFWGFTLKDRLKVCKRRWKEDLERISDSRLTKEVWKYKPIEPVSYTHLDVYKRQDLSLSVTIRLTLQHVIWRSTWNSRIELPLKHSLTYRDWTDQNLKRLRNSGLKVTFKIKIMLYDNFTKNLLITCFYFYSCVSSF